jgi:hypothetical protein
MNMLKVYKGNYTAYVKGVSGYEYVIVVIEGNCFKMAGLRVEVWTWEPQYSASCMVLRPSSGSWPPLVGVSEQFRFCEVRIAAPGNTPPGGPRSRCLSGALLETYSITDVVFRVLFTSPLCGLEWSVSGSSRFVPRRIACLTSSLEALCELQVSYITSSPTWLHLTAAWQNLIS